MKNKDSSIFFEDTEPAKVDLNLFKNNPSKNASENEKIFFSKMKEKVFGEFAPSADLILSEHDNDDEVYIVRYYFNEFRIGRGLTNNRTRENIYTDTFSDALKSNMAQLLDRDITLIDWLREIDFKGVNYNGNYAIH